MWISTGDAPEEIKGKGRKGKPNYQQQEFKADVEVKSSEDAGKICITLSNIRTVAATIVVAAGAIATATYEKIDSVAVQIGLRMGENVILQVKPVDSGTVLTYKVSSVHEDPEDEDPETGYVTIFQARDTGGPAITPLSATFVDATVSVIVITEPALNRFSLSHWECRNDFRCQTAFYNSNSNSETGIITISDVSDGEAPATANNDLFAFLVNLSGLMRGKGRVPIIIRAKRAGCKNVKTMIGFLDRVCDDGKRIKLRISKKGLKSKGCAAKKAVDGFKCSGAYELQSMGVVGSVYLTAGSSNPGGWTPSLGGAGTLRKTGVVGQYTFKFAPYANERVFNYDEEKKEVSSIGANVYLEELAKRIGGGPFAGAVALISFKPAAYRPGAGPGPVAGGAGAGDRQVGEQLFGFLTGLTRSNPGDQMGSWSATVKTSLADAEKLGDETDVDKLSFLRSDYCERRPNDPICQDWMSLRLW